MRSKMFARRTGSSWGERVDGSLAIDNYELWHILNVRVPYSETSSQTVYDNEKVLKVSDQRDIVWFVSSACFLRRHWPECFWRVKRTFCFTGAIDVLLGAVVRGPISA